MREFEYPPLARARRIRARKAAFGGYSLLLCAGLAFIFMAPDESRVPGAPSSPSLEITPAQAQAMAPSPRRQTALPIDRIMTASVEVLGRSQAPDVWSTPLQLAEPGAEEPVTPPPTQAGVEPPAAEISAQEGPLPVPVVQANPTEQAGPVEQVVPVETERALPAQRAGAVAAPAALTFKSITGTWAAHRGACSERNGRSAYLPLVIHQGGARAGNASCAFRRTAQDGSRWSVAANCTDQNETWTANVRLVLAGNRLTWSSERGAQTYTRCP